RTRRRKPKPPPSCNIYRNRRLSGSSGITDSPFPKKRQRQSTNGLAGILAHYTTRGASSDDSHRYRTAHRLLDHLLALALEVSRRSRRRPPHRPASNRARLLSADRAGPAQPTGALVASPN